MNDRKTLNDEVEHGTTQACADAETAQSTSCTYCKKTDVPLRQAAYVDKPACEPCAEIVERSIAARITRAYRQCKPWCTRHDYAADVCHADPVDDGFGGDVGLTFHPDDGVMVHVNEADALSLHEALDYSGAILAQARKALPPKETVSPTLDMATALQAMRDTLGVDKITDLSLADAVKVGVTLGMLLAAEGDFHDKDLSDNEHDTLRLAVQDLLNRRRGVDPDLERSKLIFQWGNLSAWQLAAEFNLSADDIAHIANREGTDAFSETERDRLLDLLEDIVNERMGLNAPGSTPAST